MAIPKNGLVYSQRFANAEPDTRTVDEVAKEQVVVTRTGGLHKRRGGLGQK